MPKLVINAGGDEFFLPDDNHYFWDDLVGPKYFRYVLAVYMSEGNFGGVKYKIHGSNIRGMDLTASLKVSG